MGHLDALPVPQLECLLIVAVERLQCCLKSRWKLKRIEFLAFAAPFVGMSLRMFSQRFRNIGISLPGMFSVFSVSGSE